MISSDTQGHRAHPYQRIILAIIVVIDLVSFWFFLGDARATSIANATEYGFLTAIVSGAVVRTVLAVIAISAAVIFAIRPAQTIPGLAALLTLMLFSHAHADLFGSPWRHMFFSGVCLAGWLLGLQISKRGAADGDESYAKIGALALLGAAYCNAGISKFVFSGGDWINGVAIQGAIVGQDGLIGDSPLSAYRSWAVTTPWAATVFSVATVFFESAGVLMPLGGIVCPIIAAGLAAMHINIYLLTHHIVYWQSVVLLIAFGVGNLRAPATSIRSLLADREFPKQFAGLALWALIAILFQAGRHVYLGR